MALAGQNQQYMETRYWNREEGLGAQLELTPKVGRGQIAVEVLCCHPVRQWAWRAVNDQQVQLLLLGGKFENATFF